MVDEAVVCIKCGCAAADIKQQVVYINNPNDAPSTGFAVLSGFFPPLGFVLWLVWNNSSPKKAKSCGKGALFGMIAYITATLLLFTIGLKSCYDLFNNTSQIHVL